MNTLIESLITELVDAGISCTLSKHAILGYKWDLNTMAKSHVWLFSRDGKIFADMRYDEQFEITDMDDLKICVRRAMHGRDFINYDWSKFLDM